MIQQTKPRGKRTLTAALALLLAGSAFAVEPSTQFSLTGKVANPAIYDLGDLQALPGAITQTVSYSAGGVPQTRTYTGTSLWGMINQAGIVNNPAVKNDVLNKYVVATGTDGYRSVFSLGELNPNFGNRASIVAYAEIVGGVAQSLGDDGFARVTAPGDVRGGRYVSNLVSLDVQSSASTHTGTGGGISSQFSVTGDVLNPGFFDLAALQALPTTTRVVDSVSYTGVSFWSLLNAAVGISLDPLVHNDVLGKYVVATGSDGYKSVFSLGELHPNFGNQPDLIAFDADGAGLGNDGFARLIVPNDDRHGRWVSNLVSLEVFSAAAPVPEPATYLLMLAGMGLIAARASRQRRHADGMSVTA